MLMSTVYASSEDHLLLRVGQNTIQIRWLFNMDELVDISNLFDVISLVANNYEKIEKQNQSISLHCFKEGGEYYIYEDTYADNLVETSYSTADRFLNALTEKIARYYGLEISNPEPFNIILLAIPVDAIESPPHDDEYAQLYYGALPGSMQFFDGRVLYYEYFFFKEDLLIPLLKNMQSFKGVLIKKQIDADNIAQLGLFVY